MQIHTFRDWWRHNRDEILKSDDQYEAFERCWDFAQRRELQRCAELSASRLALEAQVSRAGETSNFREYMDLSQKIDSLLRDSDE